ncbi:MAG: pyridoxal phosphate-dependent aminotransferase [Clostridiales bacterium]|nr:pyridoxal phosphate-dependent aminotransferase [Clostridiales bacterium]
MPERNLDFDRVVSRKNTRCLKYDFAARRGYPEDVLPLWVADMDFRTSSYVEDALEGLTRHNIYGYSNTQPGDGFFESVSGWMKRRHGWNVDPSWHVKTPGVCFAIATAIRAFTEPGDAVLIQQPVYYPFSSLIRKNGRRRVSSDLVQDGDGNWRIDFDDFERKIAENDVKMFILCSPHNPVGRAWSAGELARIGRICAEHRVLVFSDEIHADFTWNGEHRVFQETDASFRNFTVTATSPSKTFNLAGLQQSNIFIPDSELRRRFEQELERTGYDEPTVFGIAAAQAAYEHGDEWYGAMKAYVAENIGFADRFIRECLPGIRMNKPEGTYLIWLDFRDTGLDASELDDRIIHRARLWLDSGAIFGKPGEGFQRINTACPRSVLREALERLEKAFTDAAH